MAMNALARGDVNSFVALKNDALHHQANANAIAQQAQRTAVYRTEQNAAVIGNQMAMNALACGDVNSFVALQHNALHHQANANAIAQQANANAMQQRRYHQCHHQGGF
jgi:hypothetical protein